MRKYLSLFLVSLTLLMVEIISTRYAKIVLRQHFQFIIISLALLGIGLGAIIAYYRNYKLSRVAALYAALVPLPFVIMHFHESLHESIFFITLLVVYVLSGILTALLLRRLHHRITKAYAIVMVGSAAGCLLTVVVMNAYGHVGGVVLAFLLALLAALLLGSRVVIVSLAYLLVLPGVLTLTCAENIFIPIVQYSEEKTNAFSHVIARVARGDDLWIVIDCIGQTDVVTHQPISTPYIYDLPFMLRNYSSILVIGSGGGIDVSRGLHASPRVIGVEINPLVIEEALQLTGNASPYRVPGAETVIAEGRGFVESSSELYDMIVISLIKRYGGVGIKDFIFLENYLYTVEAYASYLEHLTPEGILIVRDQTKWTDRFLPSLIAAVQRAGGDPAKNMMIIRGSISSVLIAKNSPFTLAERTRIHLLASIPKTKVYSPKNDPVKSASVITDNNPFIWRVSASQEQERFLRGQGWAAVRDWWLMLAITLAALLLVYIPQRKRGLMAPSVFLGSIGVGYIILQLMFIHKFTLFLVNPMYSITITLCSFLFFGGLGSLASKYLSDIRENLKILLVCMLGFLVSANWLTSEGLGWLFATRVVIAVAIIGVIATLMGTLMPLALKRQDAKDLPYLWGLNGIAVVLGSVIAMLSAIQIGFLWTMVLGMIAYAIAWKSAPL
ncbi:hypothetical protein CMO91_05780 [Candidatus Woesearchaeota archaeon]|nr:hypothetical protein [Candidatus Woesearchaeota archaeon]